MSAMTLRSLRDRLNNIIAENERSHWSERNDLPVKIRVVRTGQTRRGRRPKDHFYDLNCFCSSWVSAKHPETGEEIGWVEGWAYEDTKISF
jgi:hypothetical protein